MCVVLEVWTFLLVLTTSGLFLGRGFKVEGRRVYAGVRIKQLVMMVRVMVRSWATCHIHESPHKDGRASVCVCRKGILIR